METWKPVKGFESTYEVSNTGHVRRVGEFTRRKPQLTHKGYHKIFLYDGNKKKALFVHRMVAEAFLPRRSGKDIINHKNGHKLHNFVENLEWVTHKENIRHGWRTGLLNPNRGTKHGMSVLTEEIVKKIRKEYASGETFVSIAKELGVAASTVRNAIIRKTWTHV